ncbi:MAG: alpha/beta hydrolase [Candidatus Hydrogenedentes bacterium]|nr:alpha/beta hydrolase [Candidatus Hydrogenedentota bacterium]
MLWDGRAPARRPDLIALPADAPPAPKGYPTEHALFLAFYLNKVPLLETENVVVPASIEERLGVEYGRIGDRPLQLDLYRLRNLDKPAPVLIFIHGGGWRKGSRDDYLPYAVPFAEKGYVVATISYRLVQEAGFPAAVEDSKCAVRWLRENAAEVNADPDRMAVIGGSAGGYLALMVGYTADEPELNNSGGHEGVSSAVAAVVDLYGPVDLTTPYAREHETITDFIKKPYTDDPALYEYASPLSHLDADDPPTFVLHGTIDSLVPVTQSDLLVEKLAELGIDHWYDRLDGWPHTMDLAEPVNARVVALVEAFLVKHLGAP